MKRTSKSISITLILAFMLLACLLMQAVGVTGAWFTASGSNVQIIINIAGVGVNIYQNGKLVDPDKAKENPDDETLQSYISLDAGEIEPGEEIPVNLTMSTSEPSGVYVQYKFEVYALGQSEKLLTTTDIGYLEYSQQTTGFVIDNNGYYHLLSYVNQEETEVKLTRDMGAVSIMEKFAISADEFASKNLNGETIKVVVTVECQDAGFLS